MFENRKKAKLKNKAKLQYSRRTEYLLSEKTPFDIMEAFRNFKASLTVSMPKKQNGEGTVIVMTSAVPEDGKTTVSVNLALIFGISKAKVLLIDADVRKGRISRFFKVKTAPGLADYLSGLNSLEEVIHTPDYNEYFSFITCGTHSPRPYELLESDEMKNLLAKLRKEYDYIIIDTPPMLVVSDALAVGTKADGMVVVSRHEISYLNDIQKVLNKIEFAKANLLGVVVNGYNANAKNIYKSSERYTYYSYVYDNPNK